MADDLDDAQAPIPTTFSVDLADATRQLTDPQSQWLAAHALAAGKRLRCIGQARIRVIDDTEMAKAHEEFAGEPGTTDVLTFDLREGDLYDPNVVLGPQFSLPDANSHASLIDTDILICVDEARRQAASRDYPFERELLLYVVHAILHCLGLDDHDEEQAAAMHRLEDAVLEAVGVGPVYRVQPRQDG